jgi:hypothetical protein
MGTYLKSMEYYSQTYDSIVDCGDTYLFVLCVIRIFFTMLTNSESGKIHFVSNFQKIMIRINTIGISLMMILFVLCIMPVCNNLFFLLSIIAIWGSEDLHPLWRMLIILIIGEIGVRFCLVEIGKIKKTHQNKLQIILYHALWRYEVLYSGGIILVLKDCVIHHVLQNGQQIDPSQYDVVYCK